MTDASNTASKHFPSSVERKSSTHSYKSFRATKLLEMDEVRTEDLNLQSCSSTAAASGLDLSGLGLQCTPRGYIHVVELPLYAPLSLHCSLHQRQILVNSLEAFSDLYFKIGYQQPVSKTRQGRECQRLGIIAEAAYVSRQVVIKMIACCVALSLEAMLLTGQIWKK